MKGTLKFHRVLYGLVALCIACGSSTRTDDAAVIAAAVSHVAGPEANIVPVLTETRWTPGFSEDTFEQFRTDRITTAVLMSLRRRNRGNAILPDLKKFDARIVMISSRPSSQEAYRVTLPAYDPTGRAAVVYVALHCGPLCGVGQIVYLERSGERWDIVEVREPWRS